MTIILRTNPLEPDLEVIKQAAKILLEGGVVAFPTETVYGLGALVFNEKAVSKVFWAKKRPPDNPLIIHISSISMLDEVAVDIPEEAYRLIRVLWPGPLTLILRRHPQVPKLVTGGLDTVAVRMPAHPVAISLIKELGIPIAAPSANIAGRPSPTTAEHVIRDLQGRIDAVIDAGETIYGVESTIIDILSKPPVLMRPGAYPVEEIEKILGTKIEIPDFARGLTEANTALAPGVKYRHYSPETPLILVESSSSDLSKIINAVKELSMKYAENENKKVCIVASSETISMYEFMSMKIHVLNIGSRNNLFEIARNLFRTLRSLDELSCDIAIIEGVEEKGLGLTIMNRLRKAAKLKIRV
ncbi:MAG: L-threonylcarbamoyladenylate synthase [Desulfurococcaceae archaeon]